MMIVMDQGKDVNRAFLKFAKAFESINHRLLHNVKTYSMHGQRVFLLHRFLVARIYSTYSSLVIFEVVFQKAVNEHLF